MARPVTARQGSTCLSSGGDGEREGRKGTFMTTVPTSAGGRFVVDLGDPAAGESACSGSKAASLAIARGSRIPVIPGFVLTTAGHARFLRAGAESQPELAAELHDAWASLESERSGPAGRPVVVHGGGHRGFVHGRPVPQPSRRPGVEAFQKAVVSVLQSADEVADGAEPSPMGVLVQHFLRASRGGVLFGIDPVTGDGRQSWWRPWREGRTALSVAASVPSTTCSLTEAGW